MIEQDFLDLSETEQDAVVCKAYGNTSGFTKPIYQELMELNGFHLEKKSIPKDNSWECNYAHLTTGSSGIVYGSSRHSDIRLTVYMGFLRYAGIITMRHGGPTSWKINDFAKHAQHARKEAQMKAETENMHKLLLRYIEEGDSPEIRTEACKILNKVEADNG